MSTPYVCFTDQIRRLARSLDALAPTAAIVGVASPAGEEWFDLLCRKLLPQLEVPPMLIVAIVGGTNIGKSVIFNHLAGEVASAATPLAAGTKHPVGLVPPGCDDGAMVQRLFEAFELHPWHSPDDPIGEADQHRLYWRAGAQVPPRLVLLDAPDVDSDVTVNWSRARAVRQTADVLVAVLTQQKYNDAAVKQFFRAAVEADKPIIVVFNFCDLVEDREYWPQWLAQFCAETGARPELVYVVPFDRAAAGELRLPFYRVGGPSAQAKGSGPCFRTAVAPESNFVSPKNGPDPGSRSPSPTDAPSAGSATSLRNELASLHFDAIKIRTFRGALGRVLDPHQGVPAYLAGIREAAGQFSAAVTTLSATEMARVAWPTLPTGVLVEEMRCWWDEARSPWSRQIHGFYRTVGRGVTWPIRAAWDALAGPQAEPLAAFHQQEREAVVVAVEKLLDELDRLAQVGNEILRPRLQRLLSGHARTELLRQVEAAHAQLPAVDEDYRAFLRAELDAWKAANAPAVRFLQTLDHAVAVARPAITVSLFVSGWVLAGDLVGQAAMHAVGHTAGQIATEAAIAGGITGGGEALVSTTSEGVRQAAARLFRRLQARYAQQRARWLAGCLERELLGDLLTDLRRGAEVSENPAFREAEVAARELADAT